MLNQIQVGPTDPILRMLALYHADPNPDKIDLGIGVYRTKQGMTPVMKAVKRAEKHLLKEQTSKTYLGPAGDPLFNRAITQLLFDDAPVTPGHLCTLQTPGGTGALRVAGDLLKRANPHANLWLSTPHWVTHRPIFTAAGFHLSYYRYFDSTTRQLDFSGMLEDLRDAQPGDIVVIQVSGHNPTGCDLNIEQWEQLSEMMLQRGLLPLLDLAYHGLVSGLDRDLAGLRIIQRQHPEWLLCYSASKSFGIYIERTGALFVRCPTTSTCERVHAEALNQICSNYYMPPGHGAAIVRTILNDADLKALWHKELAEARDRLADCRLLLSNTLNANSAWQYRFLAHQSGMFNYLGLTDAAVNRLREEHSIYIGTGGRINVAGINKRNVKRISDALKAVQR